MRLEQLFQQLNHFMAGGSVFDKRAAIGSLLDILTIFSRSDLKSELIKELDRHAKVLGLLSHSQDVDSRKLEGILGELSQASRNLYNASGKVGASVMESGLFQSISQRSSIPGGSCSFDVPAAPVRSICRHFITGWSKAKPNNRKISNNGPCHLLIFVLQLI